MGDPHDIEDPYVDYIRVDLPARDDVEASKDCQSTRPERISTVSR